MQHEAGAHSGSSFFSGKKSFKSSSQDPGFCGVRWLKLSESKEMTQTWPLWQEERWPQGQFLGPEFSAMGQTEKWEGVHICPSRAFRTISHCMPSRKPGVLYFQHFLSRKVSRKEIRAQKTSLGRSSPVSCVWDTDRVRSPFLGAPELMSISIFISRQTVSWLNMSFGEDLPTLSA